MLLAIDIGNTSITLGILRKTRVIKTCQVETVHKTSNGRTQGPPLQANLKKVLRETRRKYPEVHNVVICSVVPRVLNTVKAAVISELHLKPAVIGRDMIVPIPNRYRNPAQVGDDRLVCAYAVARLYGIPAIVIDLGTAITFDVVSRKGEYLGGIIVPGIRLSAETLFQKTALLPKTPIRKPRSLIGKDTEDSILSGLFYGYGAMLQGLIAQISKKIKGHPKVIVTGGYTRLMKKYIPGKINAIDEHLILKGMSLLWEDRPKKIS